MYVCIGICVREYRLVREIFGGIVDESTFNLESRSYTWVIRLLIICVTFNLFLHIVVRIYETIGVMKQKVRARQHLDGISDEQ